MDNSTCAGDARREAVSRALGGEIMAAIKDNKTLDIWSDNDGMVCISAFGKETGPLLRHDGTPVRMNGQQVRLLINNVAAALDVDFTGIRPMVENLPFDSCYFDAAAHPLVERPGFSIHKRSTDLTLHDYVQSGAMTSIQSEYIRSAVKANKRILVVGGALAGKTILLNAILRVFAECRADDTLAIIDDLAELQCQVSHLLKFCTTDTAPADQLIKKAMECGAHYICLGEVRSGSSALALLKEWSMGIDGSTSIHAIDGPAALRRLEQMLQEVSDLPQRQLIADAVDVIVQIQRRGGIRSVAVLELGLDKSTNEFTLVPI